MLHKLRSVAIVSLLMLTLVQARNGFAVGTWESIGPDNVAGVTIIKQGPSGELLALAIPDIDEQLWRVYRTEDLGINWDVIYIEEPESSFHVNDLLIYSATAYFLATSKGVLRTVNSGDSWTTVGLENVDIESIGMRGSGELMAGGGQTFYLSSDLGETWSSSVITNEIDVVQKVLEDSQGRLFCVMTGGVYRSTDQGNSWQSILEPSPPSIDSLFVAGSINAGDDAFIIEGNTFCVQCNQVYRSLNHGDSWKVVLDALPFNTFPLAISATGEIFLANSENIYHSQDNGESWEIVFDNTTIGLSVISALYINPFGDFFVGGHGGIFLYSEKVSVTLTYFVIE